MKLQAITKTLYKGARVASKHAPAIATATGVVLLGVTIYTTWKAKDKVDAHLEQYEEKRENGEEVKTTDVVIDIAKDVAVPVAAGTAAVVCFVGSYYIMNKRIVGLSAALAGTMTQYERLRNKVATEHGADKLKEYETPVEVTEITNEDGTTTRKADTVNLKSKQSGFWYSLSSFYEADDYEYNISMIEKIDRDLTSEIMKKGAIKLNHVLESFGVEGTPEGGVLMFTDATWKGISYESVVSGMDEYSGKLVREIWVGWDPMDLKFAY